MAFITIFDTDIVAVNCSEKGSLVYRDNSGRLHQIDFDSCADHYKRSHEGASDRCIGQRNVSEHCFILYTSGIKTRILFKKKYVFHFLKHRLLFGGRAVRFFQLQRLIERSKYTTFDRS